jgi:hypothetical protein
MRTSTKQKYLEALKYMADKNAFHGKLTAEQLKITNTFFSVCIELGLLRRAALNGTYTWNLSREPMMSDVESICLRLRAKMQAHRLKVKPSPQLTIKPIRKAPAPAPMSVNAEPECDTTNSKMMLILGAGLLIGFMIATLIWK